MREKITVFVSYVAGFLEFVITMMLAVGVGISCYRLIGGILHFPGVETFPEYQDLLTVCFNLIIGVELIRMMYYHTADMVFEVLVFAIARQIIIDHSSAVTNLLGVISISILFGTRKYLYSRSRDFMRAEEEVMKHNGKHEEASKKQKETNE